MNLTPVVVASSSNLGSRLRPRNRTLCAGRPATNLHGCPLVLATIATFLLQNMMTALMLAIGLSTSVEMLRETWHERRLVWKALVLLELAVPLLAVVTVLILPV